MSRFASSLFVRCTSMAILAVLTLFFLACSGGGSGDSSSAQAVSSTGSVSIFLTDAASDDFDEILITITSIDLLGNGDAVNIFFGRETVDLKDLENFSDLFVHSDEVPVGTYNKIRMYVNKVELVDGDDVIDVDPPAHGKIDLLPRDPFQIREGVNLVIEIDMDAKKSIHVHGTGQGKYRFRPVVFVTIHQTRSPRKLARVHGVITQIIDRAHFELCSTVFMAARTNSSEEGDEEGGIGDRHRCMTVEIDRDTGLFDPNGDPVGVGALMEDEEVTVIGKFHMIDDNHDDMMAEQYPSEGGAEAVTSHRAHHLALEAFAASRQEESGNGSDSDTDSDRDTDRDTDSDSDSEDGDRPRPPSVEIMFLAYTVEIGPPGTFLHLKGVIESELDDMDEFDFALAAGQGFGEDSVVTALLQDGTRIFARNGTEVGEEEIMANTDAKIDGVFATDAAGTFYKTALLVLDLQVDPADVLRGEVVSADSVARQIQVDVGDDDECVDVPEEAGIFLVSEGEDGATSEEGDFDDLVPGLMVDVFGEFEEIGGCFVAETIIGFPMACSDSEPCPTGQFCAREQGSCSAGGTCEPTPGACTRIFDPVCGCDGKTYSNACVAASAGVSVDTEGACDDGGTPLACGGLQGVLCPAGELCVVEAGLCEPGA